MIKEGQFIEATKNGLSPPQPFDKDEVLRSFGKAEFSSPLAPRLTPHLPSTPNAEPASSVAPNTPPIKIIPPTDAFLAKPRVDRPKEPEIKPEALAQKKPEPTEEKGGDFTLLAFQAGLLTTTLVDNTPVKALTALWTPRFIFPVVPLLSIHGSFGGSYSPGSFGSNLIIMEYQIFVTLSVLKLFFIEAGMGEQIWRGDRASDAGLATVNLGLLVKLGFIDRIFFGYQVMNSLPVFNQYKLGIEVKF